MRKSIHYFKTASLFILLFFICFTASAQVMQRNPNVVIGELIKVIPSLKDLKPDTSNKFMKHPAPAMDDKLDEAEERAIKVDRHAIPRPDPVVQRSFVTANRTSGNTPNFPDPPGGGSAQLNFDGSGYTNVSPADTNMCAGPNHIIQMINNSNSSYFRIWNRNGVQLVPQTILSVMTGNSYIGNGDSVALYDQFADRFMLTEFGTPLSGSAFINTLIIAVSQTNDPTGGWYVYKFTDNTFFVDYPKWVIWPNVMYATSNDFNTAGTAYLGSSVYAANKTKMLVGNATAEIQRFRLTSPDNRYLSVAPVGISGSTPPAAGSPGMFMYYNDDNYTPSTPGDVDSISILTLQPDFVTPANTTLSFLQGFAVAPFKSNVCAGRNCVPSASGNGYDAISSRIMNHIYYRNFGVYEALVLNHTVDANYPSAPVLAGIRWYELRKIAGSWGIFQQSTYSPDGDGRWMGTININSKGQIALGFDLSSSTKFASIYYTGRQPLDPLGTLTAGDVLIRAGTAYGTFANRWGDYNDLPTDIVNDSLFWITSMYGSAAASWSTRVASFKLNGCVSPQVLTNPVNATICAGSNTSFTAAAVNGSPGFQWQVSTDGGNTFTNISDGGPYTGTLTTTLTVTAATVGLNNNFYRCAALNGCTFAYTTPGKLVVVGPPVITPSSASVCAGTIQQLTIAFGGAPGPVGGTGSWSPITDYYTNAGATIAYTAGAQLNTVYTKPSATITYAVTPGAGACTSTPTNITVTVNPAPTVNAPTVTQPSCPAPTGTIIVNATGSGILEYSLNGGAYQLSNTFSGLAPGSYTIAVRIQSSPACVINYSGNPVVLNPPNTAVTTVSYTGPAVAIPDNVPAGIDITLPVSGLGTISDLNFRFDAASAGTCDATVGNTNAACDHTFIGDLIFKLTSPLGTSVILFNRRGGTMENICTTLLDDDGGFPSLATLSGLTGQTCNGNFAPDNPLSAFDGQNPNGNWVLNVSDNAAVDIGSMRRFSLIFTSSAPCPCTGPTVTAPTITQPTCTSPTGTIVVNATGTGTLEYSINGGITYVAGNSFSGLAPGNYNIFVRLQSSPTCITAYSGNPVVLATPSGASLVYAYNFSNTHLISFNTSTPGTLVTDIPLTGLNAGEFLLGIDFRPADGLLYSMTSQPSNLGGMVSINRFTGVVTHIGTTTPGVLAAPYYGNDFNPVVDRLRLIGTDGTNRRFNPNDGSLVATDTPPAYVVGDPGFGTVPSISQIAYDKNLNGVLSTTLYGYDYSRDVLVRVGGPGGVPSPNSGQLTSIGASGVVTGSPAGGFDIEPVTNTAYAVLRVAGVSNLYTVNLASGAVTLVGAVGVGAPFIDGMTMVPCNALPTQPTVTINQAVGQPDPTFASPINFTAVFSQPVTGFTASGVVLSGTAGATTVVITGGPSTYNVAVSGMVTAGTVIANIPAGVAINATQQGNLTSTSTDNTVTYFPCSLTCPANITVNTTPGQCGAVVNFAPITIGTCGTVTATPASGSFFPKGTTTVTVTSTAGVSCTFTVTVIDNQAPAITCPANVTVSCASAVPAANIASVTATDNCPGTVVTFVGDVISAQTCANRFVVTRTYRATDAVGNSSTCSQTITVNDVTPPVITCPANMTVTTPIGSCTAVVNFTPTATDNCTGAVTIVNSPASGSVFPIGTTTVTSTATDVCGNVSTCTFTVTVLDGQLPVITVQPVNKTVCAGSTATFSVTATNAVSYQWQQYNGTSFVNVAGATSSTLSIPNTIITMNTNTFRVNVIGLCTTVSSGAASLYVNPLPTVSLSSSRPPVLLPGQSLTITATVSPTGGTYVWFKNGVVIPGASGNTLTGLTVDDIGAYHLVYTDPNGCVSTSADMTISAQPSGNLYVYPVPNAGQFSVRFYNAVNEKATISIYDEKGARVYSRAFTTTVPYTRLSVDISKMPASKYLVEVVNAAGKRIGAKWIVLEH